MTRLTLTAFFKLYLSRKKLWNIQIIIILLSRHINILSHVKQRCAFCRSLQNVSVAIKLLIGFFAWKIIKSCKHIQHSIFRCFSNHRAAEELFGAKYVCSFSASNIDIRGITIAYTFFIPTYFIVFRRKAF